MSNSSGEIIQSIVKVPEVLDVFTTKNLCTLHDIHLKTGFSKTTASRICNTLVKIGYLEKVFVGQTPYYQLGIELYRLGRHAIESIDIQSSAKKYLQIISERLGDNSYLFIEKKQKALCIEKIKGSYYIQTATTHIGDTLPFYKGGGPLSMLAFYNNEKQQAIMKQEGLLAAEIETLLPRLKEINSCGFALSLNEFAQNTGALGVPVFGLSNEVVGALSVGGIVDRFQDDRIPVIEEILKENALALSLELGYVPNDR